ncbi:MAG: ABC transporter permease [Actinomycetia bacterium]|nr:ABC transporter permease [Actinomycetes bacterium]
MSRWAASLRIARRAAWSHKGRSALVLVMIALPVAAIVFGVVAFRTLQLEPEQQVTSQIGTAADAFVGQPGNRAIAQSPPGVEASVFIGKRLAPEAASIDKLVPNATRSLQTRFRWGGGFGAPVVAGDRRDYPSIRELDYTDPLAAGLVQQVSGDAPAAPDEVGITEDLAETLVVDAGDGITVKDAPYTVVGIVRLPYGSDWSQVIGNIGTFDHLEFSNEQQGAESSGWLVQVPGGVDYEQWKQLNAQGAWVISRAVAANPPDPCTDAVPHSAQLCDETLISPSENEAIAEAGALVGLVVVMGLLQVILLVGPAFAIGRRSQTRDLALVAAVGGDARAVRRVVLSGGLVLGVAGGVAGLLVGIGAFQLLRPVVSNLAGTALFATDLHPELVLVLLVTAATGLAAAWLPARAASRQDVVAALAGRRGALSTRRGMPLAGALAFIAGLAIAVFGTTPGNMTVLLLGAVISEVGLVAMAPWIVGAVSGFAARLPTAPRIALRDAGRNRLRAGTAVSAVLAAVAGATAMGIWVASDNANAERHYVSTVPEGYVALAVNRGQWPGDDVSVVEAALPTDRTVPMMGLPESSCLFQRCSDWKVEQHAKPCQPSVFTEETGSCGYSFGSPWRAWMFGDGQTYRALTGAAPDPEVTSTLADGGVVVGTWYASAYVKDGLMTFEHRKTGEVVQLPATVAASSEVGPQPRFEVLLSEGARASLGLESRDLGYTIITTRAPTDSEVAGAREAVAELTDVGSVVAGRPFEPSTALPLLIVLAAAVLLAVAATATATGLAAADSRPDLATLAAIGASPRTRRWLSASQAAVISVLGTALGVAGGLVIGVAAIGATTDNLGLADVQAGAAMAATLPVTVPWASLTTLAVVVPAVAVTLAFLFSRSSLPMIRRVE